jgi:AbrB family looped-hinge helix DNA binding protein
MNNQSEAGKKYMGSVKVGAKGQIVIPKEVRDMFGIKPGDSLILLADSKKGIALERMSIISKIADAILNGNAREEYPDIDEEDGRHFLEEFNNLREGEDEEA